MAKTLIHQHWIEISRSALLHNLRVIRSQLPSSTQIIAMLKANAYGHGITLVAPVLAPHVACFGVHTLPEAESIRSLGLTIPILITCPLLPSQFHLAQKLNLTLSVPSLEYLDTVIPLSLPLHLKINTGMNRLGLSPIQLLTALDRLRHFPHLVTGIFTHFHSSDSDSSATAAQLDIFSQTIFQAKYLFPRIQAHSANSAALFTAPPSHSDLVRPGLALYGLYSHPRLKPVLSWKAVAVQTQTVSPPQSVGYSGTYIPSAPTTISVLPLGYSDGYDRRLSSASQVYAARQFYPVVGRISMNFLSIDTGTALPPSTQFEIIGPHLPASALADRLSTISYEIVSRLNPTIPRILV